jgi:hypothetical protein
MSTIKVGDTKTLRWHLGRDLTGVDEARLHVADGIGGTLVLDVAATIVEPRTTDGEVTYLLTADDFGDELLNAGASGAHVYRVEIQTTDGDVVLTHPDNGYETLIVVEDLDSPA